MMREKASMMLAVMLVIAAAGCLGQDTTPGPKQMKYANNTLNFRAPLTLAAQVPVVPSEDTLKMLLSEPQPIAVAYVPNDSLNGFYAAASFELGYKLTIYYKAAFGESAEIVSLPVSGSDEVSAAAANQTVIFLVGNADRTSVLVHANVIEVDGKDMTENGRDYTDLDLAVDKFLITVLK